jgi:biopolymer transport protein ExbB/TolQ
MMVLLAVVIAFLVVRKVVPLAKGTVQPGPAWESGLNAILFWGAFAAVLGFLGQCFGIYNAMRAIQQADVISPTITAIGFFISFTSTMIGLTILAISALCWFALRVWSNRVATSQAS